MTRDLMEANVTISIIIPVYNESESLSPLYEKILAILKEEAFEIIFVDDGSTDDSNQKIRSLKEKDERIKLITFKSNAGKAKALNEGFAAAKGDIVFTMDGDLQDDPAEIPNFLRKLDEGYDLVSGWKKKRHDPLEKRLPSKLFNLVTSWICRIRLHDFNCGFKAYRRQVIEELDIYGDLHRFIPALAHWKGFRVGEIPVQHHSRQFGHSKYGVKRYFKGFFDLFTVVLLTRFIQRPIYLFGGSGVFILTFGIIALVFITFLQLMYGSILGHRPLTYLGVLSFLFGSQLMAAGLIAEMLVDLNPTRKKLYSIKEKIMIGMANGASELSIIIPIEEDEKHLPAFLNELASDLAQIPKASEIIFVDDSGQDDTLRLLKEFQAPKQCALKIIFLRKRFGRASALQAGFNEATGTSILTMTTGQRNILLNINRFLDVLEKADIARGRRIGFPSPLGALLSKLLNQLISLVTHIKVHDHNCMIYAFRRELLDRVRAYGERQRFYPLIAAKLGYRFIEIPIDYSHFKPGSIKGKLKRMPMDVLDIFTVVLTTDFKTQPLHLFGIIGLVVGAIGFLINAYLTVLKLQTGHMGSHYTLLLMGVMLMILGLQWFTTGLLGEIINNLGQKKGKPDHDITIE